MAKKEKDDRDRDWNQDQFKPCERCGVPLNEGQACPLCGPVAADPTALVPPAAAASAVIRMTPKVKPPNSINMADVHRIRDEAERKRKHGK